VPYTSLEKLIDRFGADMLVQLTDRAEISTGAIDTDVVDQALADTDALIDGYAAGRYAVPMSPVPALAATLALDIAIYKLHVFDAGDKITDDYKAAMQVLRMVSEGKIKLPVAGAEAAGTGGSGARITDRARDFTAESLKGYW